MTTTDSRVRCDLVVLVADKDMEQAVRQLLQRPEALGISSFTYEVYTHPLRDNGCRTASHELLRPLASQYRFALVLFDREGSGRDAVDREQLEQQVEDRLEVNGWRGRCGALVLVPELEIWVWTNSSELDQVIGSPRPAGGSAGRAVVFYIRTVGEPRAEPSRLRPAREVAS